jgi:hypothetical protein
MEMKKKFPTAFAASAALLLLITQMQTVEVANANFRSPSINAVLMYLPFFDPSVAVFRRRVRKI